MKIIKRPQSYRVRRIVEMIRTGIAGKSFPSATDFARELEVTWRTIISDLDYLRDEEGAPIEYDASKKGYYLRDAGWSLKPVTLSQREIFAFSLASKLIQPFRGTPLEMDVKSLFDKIALSLEGTVTLSTDALTDRFSLIPDDFVPIQPDTWVTMAGFIERREATRIRYQTFSGKVKYYDLLPIHLVAYHGNWYVLAFNGIKDKPITFALSRIKSMAKSNRAFICPADFDMNHYVKAAFGISHGDAEIDVRLRFAKNVAVYIAERQWNPSQIMFKRKDGSLDVHMKTRGWKELVRWILSWQPDVRVLAPRELRERVQKKMREGLRLNAIKSNKKMRRPA